MFRDIFIILLIILFIHIILHNSVLEGVSNLGETGLPELSREQLDRARREYANLLKAQKSEREKQAAAARLKREQDAAAAAARMNNRTRVTTVHTPAARNTAAKYVQVNPEPKPNPPPPAPTNTQPLPKAPAWLAASTCAIL
jgi:FtsZ-interacting cell division protein ZipA